LIDFWLLAQPVTPKPVSIVVNPLSGFGVGIAGFPHEPNLLLGTNVEGSCPPLPLMGFVDRPPMAVSWPIEADAFTVGDDDCLLVG
jgi:hypothetical protein